MSKTKSPNQSSKPRSLYSIHPWEYRSYPDHFEIVAYVEASGNWETVADIRHTSGANAETMAAFIIRLINDNQPTKNLLREAMEALELCLEEANLTFASEQAADSVVNRIKNKMS